MQAVQEPFRPAQPSGWPAGKGESWANQPGGAKL